MDHREIEQLIAARKSMTPEELALLGPEKVAKMDAAIEGYERVLEEAGEEIASGAQAHLADE
ncbi:MAG: hypothetical protein ACQEW8_10670 [Actinomycetota bacterium]